MLNRVQLIGRVTRDADIEPDTEPKMAQFVLAVERDEPESSGEPEADFVRCVAWRALAEMVIGLCVRGRLVAVDGRLQSRQQEALDGSRRRVTEIVAERLWVLK